MRTMRLIAVLALGMLLHLHADAAPACADADLQLNEFMAGPARDWDGSGTFSSRDDEWIEVINRGGATLDLTGFLLSDDDSIPRYAFSGTLAPGAVRLVTGKMSFDWEKAHAQPAFGLSLANTGGGVVLWKVVGADTMVVDAYTYRSHEAGADRSVGRSADGTTWQLFDQLDPYTGSALPAGTGCLPTPDAPNTCGTVPAQPTTWGRLKTIWR
jgi:hypothetical protein